MAERNEHDATDQARRGGKKLASILWWVAAGLSIIAFALEYSKTGKIDVPKALLIFAFLMMAILTQRGLKR